MAKATSPKGRRLRERALARRHAAIVEVPSQCDVVVVGAGPAGLMAALEAGRSGADVVILEGSCELGKPILATGNGRCNLSNTVLDPGVYGSRATDVDARAFAARTMGPRPVEDVEELFSGLGLAMVEEQGRIYPRSMRAESVRDVLVDALPPNVIAATMRQVTAVETLSDGACPAVAAAPDFRVVFEERFRERGDGWASGAVFCRAVVLASGGGHLEVLRDLPIPLTGLEPVLCPVATEPVPAASLVNRRARVVARLMRDGETIHRESGEVLFREGGLSGILAMDLSRLAHPGDSIELDLVPWLGEEALTRRIRDHLGRGREETGHVLSGLMDPAIGRELMARAQGRGGDVADEAARLSKGMAFNVVGPMDPERAQVTRGGVSLAAVDAASLAAKAVPGLHVAGELLDLDGPCGGYNLALAWLTGRRAGSSAAVWAELAQR